MEKYVYGYIYGNHKVFYNVSTLLKAYSRILCSPFRDMHNHCHPFVHSFEVNISLLLSKKRALRWNRKKLPDDGYVGMV